MIVQFRNEKVSNHGSIPITIGYNVVAFIVFEEGFHQPIKRTKQSVFLDKTSTPSTALRHINQAREIKLRNVFASNHSIKATNSSTAQHNVDSSMVKTILTQFSAGIYSGTWVRRTLTPVSGKSLFNDMADRSVFMFGSRSLQLDERRQSFEAWILTSRKVFPAQTALTQQININFKHLQHQMLYCKSKQGQF
ncbi:hypothetical protein TNCV_4215551 [Trichonephila clavipes]|nr:hypothetical protein TNCV_4215551 [Trichonephila clavipes]